MISPSPESIAADRGMRRDASYVREGETRDGVKWTATFLEDRAAFVCGTIEHHFLTHEQANAICLWANAVNVEGVEAAIARVIG
jgi:hypothetical protein